MFVGMHVLLSERIEVPEIAITQEEGEQFMKAAQNVMRHYSVETTQKTLDIIAFAGVSAQIYMPRMAAYGIRKRSERAPVPFRQPVPENVVPMNIMAAAPMDTEHGGF